MFKIFTTSSLDEFKPGNSDNEMYLTHHDQAMFPIAPVS